MDSRSLLLLAGTALSWGSSFLLIRVAVRVLDPLEVSMLRLVLGALVLWLALALMRVLSKQPADQSRRVKTRRQWLGLLLAASFLAIPFTLIGIGEKHVDSGVAGIVNATVPLWAALLSQLVDREERLTRARITGLAVGFAGVGALMAARIGSNPEGVPAASYIVLAVAAVCYALLAVTTRMFLREVSPTRIAAWTCLIPAVVLSIFVGPGLNVGDLEGKTLISIVLLGVGATGGGMFLYYQLLERVGAVRAATVNYLLPVLAVFYGAVLLGEHFRITDFLGLALVLVGVWIVGRSGGAESPRLASSAP